MLSRSNSSVRLALKVRNQCRGVIAYHLCDSTSILRNGEARLIGLLAPKTHTFVDVGANVGAWTALLLEHSPQQCRGILFEPSEYAANVLLRRFAGRNGIEIVNAAVAEVSGKGTFWEVSPAGETSSLVSPDAENPTATREVVVTTLDEELRTRGLTKVDFLKIDREGYDFHVLQGATELIARAAIGAIQFEYGAQWAKAGSTLAGAYRLLESCGYRVFLLKSQGLFELDYGRYGEFFSYSNFVAVSAGRMPDVCPFVRGIF